MDEEKRRQLREKGRLSLQKHRESREKTPSSAASTPDSKAISATTGSITPNVEVSSVPASPNSILPIPMSNLHVSSHNPHLSMATGVFDPSHASLAQTVPVVNHREAELDAQLVSLRSSLLSAQSEISRLNSEKEALKMDTTRMTADVSEWKRKYGELVETSSASLQSQQTALNKAYGAETAQLKSQMSQQHAEMTKTIDQLKQEKAEMQGTIHLLQQQLASKSSVVQIDASELETERANNSRLSLQVRDLSAQLDGAKKAVEYSRHLQQQVAALQSQHEHEIASMQMDHDSEVQQLRDQVEKAARSTAPTIPIPLTSPPPPPEEVESSNISSLMDEILAKDLRIGQLEQQLQQKTQNIGELEAQLRRTSEDCKSLQAQTSANFAQVEQMKQQVLRDRAELSRKLSLIAPETVRRVEHLQQEREIIHQQFQELSSSLAQVAQQKNDVLVQLASEVSRNSELVHQNSQLRNQLALQLESLGLQTGHIISASEQSSADQLIESLRPAAEASSSSSASNNNTQDQFLADLDSIPPKKSKSGAKKTLKAKRASPRSHASIVTDQSLAPKPSATSEIKSGTSVLPSSDTPTTNNPGQIGWLASVPIVGRLWKGQPQIRHTAQVEL